MLLVFTPLNYILLLLQASGMGAQLLSTKFSNLTHLSLGSGCSVWHQLLPYFLGSSDHLEVLKFVKVSSMPPSLPKHYMHLVDHPWSEKKNRD